MNLPRAYSGLIPRKRDAKGNPLPRSYIYGPPLITLDPEALAEAAQVIRERPEDRRGQYLWLRARNAVAASDNHQRIVIELWDRMAAETARAKTELIGVQQDLEKACRLETDLSAEIARKLASNGLAMREGQTLEWAETEPVSLESLAGQHSLPSPERVAPWSHRSGYRLLSIFGGGTVFGVSLGLLTDQLEVGGHFAEAPQLCFWAGVGMTVLALIGSAIRPLAQTVGSQLYRIGITLGWIKGLALGLQLSLLFGIVTTAIAIESRVEQLGLFKGLTEQNSLQAVALSRADLGWVSLMLVVPAVGSAMVLGLFEGERLANLDRLLYLQGAWRRELMAKPECGEVAGLLPRLATARVRSAELKTRVAGLESRIRFELNEEEKRRIEDAEMEVAGHSLAAESLLNDEPDKRGVWARAWSPGSWWRVFQRKAFGGLK